MGNELLTIIPPCTTLLGVGKGKAVIDSTMTASAALFQQACQVLPGGTAAAARTHPALGRPFFVSRGEGSRVYDLEGREYLDLCNSHGATLLGHGHPAVRRAVTEALDLGVVCSYETKYHTDLAQRLVNLIPCAELVRFTNSGTEATWHALRAARAYTGKEKVVKFEGHFHGYHDYLGYSAWPALEDVGPRTCPAVVPESGGIPEALQRYCIVLPFNDVDLLERTLRRRKDEIAAVILEPINYNSWAIRPKVGYLEAMRSLTAELGIVLIFDEILSGFRTGLSCVQGYLGVTPDLCTLGKALGGGTPLSAFAGRREIMETTAPLGSVMHSGTYNAHLLPVLAAGAFLQEISTPEFYPHVLEVSARLTDNISALLGRLGIKGRVQGVGARFGILFGIDEEVVEYRQGAQRDRTLERRFYAACLRHGVYVLGLHLGPSAAYSFDDTERTLERIESALKEAIRGD